MATTSNYASFGNRFLAALIDSVILFVADIFIKGVFKTTLHMDGLYALVRLVVTFGYAIYFIGSTGQTPGKKIMKIKVVKIDGKPVDMTSAFLRETVGKIISAMFIFLGYFWMLFDNKKQTWHDKIATTIVVNA
jgi:uncharacterized RDD family membrane protein YckC